MYLHQVLTVIVIAQVGSVLSCSRRCSNTYELSLDNGTCHGDIDDLKTNGQEKHGVAGSELSVLADWDQLTRMRDCFETVASGFCIQVSVLAAIASRESRGGRWLNATQGYSEDGKRYGIMQCDLELYGEHCLKCGWDTCCHVTTVVEQIFYKQLKKLQRRYDYIDELPKSSLIQDAVTAYNLNSVKFRKWKRPNKMASLNRDYTDDVIARAQYLKRNGWENPMRDHYFLDRPLPIGSVATERHHSKLISYTASKRQVDTSIKISWETNNIRQTDVLSRWWHYASNLSFAPRKQYR